MPSNSKIFEITLPIFMSTWTRDIKLNNLLMSLVLVSKILFIKMHNSKKANKKHNLQNLTIFQRMVY